MNNKKMNLNSSIKNNGVRLVVGIILFTTLSCDFFKKEIKTTVMTFEQSNYDFGEIKHGEKASATFKFSNVGENPLLIKNVITSCGCTVPQWEKGFINPNEKGELKVIYDAERIGFFSSSIFVYYNGLDSPKKIYIRGEIEYLSLIK